MFTDRLREEVEELDLRAVEVDTTMAEDDSAKLVTNIFGL
jgi:hypothetical protein